MTAYLVQAVADTASAYRDFPVIGSRAAIWIAAEIHLMFAAFVLGVPIFAVVAEAIGICGKRSEERRVGKDGRSRGQVNELNQERAKQSDIEASARLT